jgi:hypothetical protein
MEDTLTKALGKKIVLREIPWFGYFYFLENEGEHYIPFLKDFFYLIEIHLGKYFEKPKFVKY